MRLDRLGAGTCIGLEANSCTGSNGLLELGFMGSARSSGGVCSAFFIGDSRIGGLI